ncbi:MAG: patatin-like phospholipase family protein, partial [Pseudomonadota bacterium]
MPTATKPTAKKKTARRAAKARKAAPKTRKISLALQGGGAHGAVTWGVLDRLLEDDRIDTNAISGTSAGALNAVAVAYGLYLDGCEGARAKLDELWSAISRSGQMFSPIKRTPLDMIMGGYNLDNSVSYQFFDTLTRTFSPYQLNPFDFNPLQDVMADVIDFDHLRRCTNVNLYLSAT